MPSPLPARDLREILDEAGICTWALDPSTGRVRISENSLDVLGVPHWRLTDHAAFQALVHPEDRDSRSEAIDAALLHGGRYETEFRILRGDLGERWLRSRGQVELGPKGGASRLRGIVFSIDDQKRTEARLQEMRSELLHVSRVSAMGEMASALAHELSQPLSAVTNYANACILLLEAPLPDVAGQVMGLLRDASDQCIRAGQIVRHLKEFVSRGDTEKRLERVSALILDAASLALVGAREAGVVVRIASHPESGWVIADRVQVQQVLINLIRNARDAMAGMPRMELGISSAAPVDGMVRITVTDTGPGISDDMSARVFLPFVTTKPSGMGVGLSVSRSIIEAHGGALWAERNPDGGASFHLTLPSTEEPDDDD